MLHHPDFSRQFDLPQHKLTHSLLICSVPRSGSTWLCRGLHQVRVGVPLEYWNPVNINGFMARRVAEYRKKPALVLTAQPCEQDVLHNRRVFLSFSQLVCKKRTSANGVFAVNIHYGQLGKLQQLLASPNQLAGNETYGQQAYLLQHSHPKPVLLHVKRRDKIAQAVSLYIAVESGQWYSELPAQREVEYDFSKILYSLAGIHNEEKHWQQVLQQVTCPTMTIFYEELLNDYPKTIQKICDFLQVHPFSLQTVKSQVTRKQRNLRSQEWRQRFAEEARKAGYTPL